MISELFSYHALHINYIKNLGVYAACRQMTQKFVTLFAVLLFAGVYYTKYFMSSLHWLSSSPWSKEPNLSYGSYFRLICPATICWIIPCIISHNLSGLYMCFQESAKANFYTYYYIHWHFLTFSVLKSISSSIVVVDVVVIPSEKELPTGESVTLTCSLVS